MGSSNDGLMVEKKVMGGRMWMKTDSCFLYEHYIVEKRMLSSLYRVNKKVCLTCGMMMNVSDMIAL
jgi:hypothetical protein